MAIFNSYVKVPEGNIDPGSHRGWKMSFLLTIGDFQGPTVNLPEGKMKFTD